MKFAIAAEHRHYFHHHQLLELEGLLSPIQAASLVESIKAAVFKRSGPSKGHLSANEQFMLAHDIWRSDPAIAKIVMQLEFAKIAAELTHSRVVRLGYDQWFPPISSLSDRASTYDELLSTPVSLRSVSCLQGVICGLMLCLSDFPDRHDVSYEGVFSRVKGNGVFIAPERGIDFPTLCQRFGQQFLLIVYTEKTALYTMQESDPHVHELKKLGYVFGDKLNDRLHPIICR